MIKQIKKQELTTSKVKKSSNSIAKTFLVIILLAPFFIAIGLLIFNLHFVSDISLLAPFSINIRAVILFAIIHYVIVVILLKQSKISIALNPKFRKLRTVTPLVLLLFSSFLLSLLLVMSLRMNLNYFWRSNSAENIKIYISNKYVSYGRATDYYIEFDSENRKLKYKIDKNTYHNLSIGEGFNVEVNRGYFDGYFLTKKLK